LLFVGDGRLYESGDGRRYFADVAFFCRYLCLGELSTCGGRVVEELVFYRGQSPVSKFSFVVVPFIRLCSFNSCSDGCCGVFRITPSCHHSTAPNRATPISRGIRKTRTFQLKYSDPPRNFPGIRERWLDVVEEERGPRVSMGGNRL
jgi:hypothetical protein